MTPDSLKFIEQAEDVAKSGRWKALNEKIKEIAENPNVEWEWSLKVQAPLASAVFSEYLELKKEYKAGQGVSLLSWRARNLFELSIWCMYCSIDDNNAKRFYEDVGRDGADLLKSFLKWGIETNQDAAWLKAFQDAQLKLTEVAQLKGLSIDGTYKRVQDAANECGFKVHYDNIYKILSKLAHQTAYLVLGSISDNNENALKSVIFGQGCLFFIGAFTVLESHFFIQEE